MLTYAYLCLKIESDHQAGSYNRLLQVSYEPIPVRTRLFNFNLANPRRFYSSTEEVSDRKGFREISSFEYESVSKFWDTLYHHMSLLCISLILNFVNNL